MSDFSLCVESCSADPFVPSVCACMYVCVREHAERGRDTHRKRDREKERESVIVRERHKEREYLQIIRKINNFYL